jgi:eukaryotic-like serine/threonine-protein kinase
MFVAPVRDGTPDTSAARPIAASRFAQQSAEFSPDGRWIAYQSFESGPAQVYVLPFPGPGEKRPLSSGGAGNPAWSADGGELFFVEGRPANRLAMMAMDVSTAGEFTAGRRHALFEVPGTATTPLRSYDVTADGQFIMNLPEFPPAEPVSTLHVVIGRAGDLTTRVPAGE